MEFLPFSPKQLRALTWWCKNSPYQEKDALICDGAVRSGKTVCMGVSFIAWAFYRFNGADFALCGKTIRSIRRNLVVPLLPALRQLGFDWELKTTENLLVLTRQGRTNRFSLFGGRDESSCALIQGMTLAGVLLDEVALMPRSFVEQALARCSVPGSKFWFNCNPEHPGHWFYREWIQQAAQKNALYLHFTMRDNPALTPEILRRYENLYSGVFYQRFIEGQWVAAQGLVYPFMQSSSAFCPPPPPPYARRVVSCDYGTMNPASFGLWVYRGKVWYRVREYYYDARREGAPRTDEEHYQALERLIGGGPVECVVVDPSAASFMEVIRRHGSYPVVPAKNGVLDGLRQTGAALKQGSIKICDTCRDSIREFGLYRWKEPQGRDVPVKEHDHAMDDIRYFVATLLEGTEGFCALAVHRQESPARAKEEEPPGCAPLLNP